MSLPAPIDLNEWFNDQITRYLVLLPTSTSPQPVHVLNGFFNSSLTGQRASKAAVDFVATKQGGGWALGNQDLLKKSPLDLPKNEVKLDKARRAVSSLIAADRAVYTGFASFQLANLGLVTSDNTHLRMGELAARLALAHPDGSDRLTRLIERLAEPQPNPHWAIEKVLAEPRILDGISVGPPPMGRWWAADKSCGEIASHLGGLMSLALELSVTSRDSLLGLQVLASTATLVGLLTFAQVPGLLSGDGLSTLLCEAGEPGALPSIRSASAYALGAIDSRFQEFLFNELLNEIRVRWGADAPRGAAAIRYLVECKPKKMSGGTVLTDQIPEIYRTWLHDYPTDVAMARTLQEALTSAMGNKARDWFAAVGRHCGLVGPRRGNLPRLRVEVSLAPALVLAGLSSEDGPVLSMADWSDRLAGRYGLTFGPSERTRRMPNRATENELEANQSELAALLSSLGLARRYSDGVTEILNPLVTWAKK